MSRRESCQAPALRAQATAFIVRHFAAVVQTDAFAELVSERSRPLLLALLREVGTVVSPAGLAASDGLLGVAGGLPAGEEEIQHGARFPPFVVTSYAWCALPCLPARGLAPLSSAFPCPAAG